MDGRSSFFGICKSTFLVQCTVVRRNSEETNSKHNGNTDTATHDASRLEPMTLPVPSLLLRILQDLARRRGCSLLLLLQGSLALLGLSAGSQLLLSEDRFLPLVDLETLVLHPGFL